MNNKDEFIQKSHMRRLVQSLDPDSFLHLFLPGLEAGIKRFEEERVGHAADEGVSSRIGDKMGPLVPLARPGEDGNMTEARNYIKKVIGLDAKSYRKPDTYLERNMYLLWQVPDSLYLKSLREEMDGLCGFFYREAQKNGDGEGQPDDVPQQLSELVTRLRGILLGISDAEWSRNHIDEQVTPFVNSVFSKPKTSPYQNWGFHLLRWVLAGLQPGPALFPTIEILGKEETMRRVEQAIDIARHWDNSRA